MKHQRHLFALLMIALATPGCFRYRDLPAAVEPEQNIPFVHEAPPTAGSGEVPVTFDLVVGRALVQDVDVTGTTTTTTVSYSHGSGRDSHESTGSFEMNVKSIDVELAHAICTTPCVANFRSGPHTIRLQPLDGLGPDAVDDHVGFQLGARPIVVRAELRQDHAPSKLPATLLYMLATGLVAGGATSLAFGSDEQPGWFIGGGITMGIGAIAGVVGLIVDAATIGYRRKGASTYWEPSGGSFSVK